MITNFEEITQPLTDQERQLVKILVQGFSKISKDKPMKAPEVIKQVNAKYGATICKLSGPRLRKLVNYIRGNGIIPLIATSSGYYCSTDPKEIDAQIKSLRQRAEAIINAADGLAEYKAINITAPTMELN